MNEDDEQEAEEQEVDGLHSWPGYDPLDNLPYSYNIGHNHNITMSPQALPAPILIDAADEDTVHIQGNLVIQDQNGENKIDVGEFMKTIGERLCVLQPNLEAHEQYPALKDAYDQYKMLEKLLLQGNNAKKD